MRDYQISICQAIVNKRTWGGNNTVVQTEKGVTKIYFYGNLIGVVNHGDETVKCDNCGYNTASTTARINAIKDAGIELGYKIIGE